MIWLPRATDNSTYFAQSLEIRGIESRLYIGLIHFKERLNIAAVVMNQEKINNTSKY